MTNNHAVTNCIAVDIHVHHLIIALFVCLSLTLLSSIPNTAIVIPKGDSGGFPDISPRLLQ